MVTGVAQVDCGNGHGFLGNARIDEVLSESRAISGTSMGHTTTGSSYGANTSSAISRSTDSSGKSIYEYHDSWYYANRGNEFSTCPDPTYEAQGRISQEQQGCVYDSNGHVKDTGDVTEGICSSTRSGGDSVTERDENASDQGSGYIADPLSTIDRDFRTDGLVAFKQSRDAAADIATYLEKVYATHGIHSHATNAFETKCLLPPACKDSGLILTDLIRRFGDIAMDIAVDDTGGIEVTITQKPNVSSTVSTPAFSTATDVDGYVLNPSKHSASHARGDTTDAIAAYVTVTQQDAALAKGSVVLFAPTAAEPVPSQHIGTLPAPPTSSNTHNGLTTPRCIPSAPLGRDLAGVAAVVDDVDDSRADDTGTSHAAESSDTDAADDASNGSFYSPVNAVAAHIPRNSDGAVVPETEHGDAGASLNILGSCGDELGAKPRPQEGGMPPNAATADAISTQPRPALKLEGHVTGNPRVSYV